MLVLYLGVVLVIGVLAGKAANFLKLPAVTGHVMAGVLIGPSVGNRTH